MIESQLVKQLLAGRDVLMGFILALVRDYDLAEELFQETAVAILAEAEKDTRPRDFMPWARTIARHRIADHFRRQARRSEVARTFDDMVDVVARAFDENEPGVETSHHRLKALRQCLQNLGHQARRIVDLRYQRRLALRDIAAEVGWKENSVKVALSKARRALADCVATKTRQWESAAIWTPNGSTI